LLLSTGFSNILTPNIYSPER